MGGNQDRPIFGELEEFHPPEEPTGFEFAAQPLKADWEAFGKAIMESWPHCGLDGFDLQEIAEKHHVILSVPGGYDPKKHGPDEYDAEPGAPYYTRNYKRD